MLPENIHYHDAYDVSEPPVFPPNREIKEGEIKDIQFFKQAMKVLFVIGIIIGIIVGNSLHDFLFHGTDILLK